MGIIHYPVNAAYLGNYKILVEFENGELRIIDCSKWLQEDLKSFNDIKREDYFKQFFIKDGILQWPNEYDVAPDYLYDLSKPAKVVEVA
jgi:hypothetical protein